MIVESERIKVVKESEDTLAFCNFNKKRLFMPTGSRMARSWSTMKQDGSILSLFVSGVKRRDTGKYSCVITNS